jgi:molecular chaperone GrpE
MSKHHDDTQPDSDIIQDQEEEFELEEEEIVEGNTNDRLKKLRQELKACQSEKAEYLTGWQRAKADLVNAERRMQQESTDRLKFANQRLIEDLLPVLDSFAMAFGNKQAWEAVDENWRVGVEFIHTQFFKTLSDYGLSLINQMDVELDPMRHESIETVPTNDESKDHHVAEVIQNGYQLQDKVIRPAKVKIYKFSK